MGTRGEINNQTGSERIDKRSFILSRVCDRHVYMNNINIYRSNLKRNSLQLSIGNINLFRLRKGYVTSNLFAYTPSVYIQRET